MSEKHRNLPLWMVKSDVQASKVKVNDAERKKTKTTRPRSAIAFWMNERELVETALCILKETKACAQHAAQTADAATVIPESDCETSDERDADRDIAEQETVPYGDCVGEGTGRPKPHVGGSETSETRSHLEESSQKPASDDEALELVREIFFT